MLLTKTKTKTFFINMQNFGIDEKKYYIYFIKNVALYFF